MAGLSPMPRRSSPTTAASSPDSSPDRSARTVLLGLSMPQVTGAALASVTAALAASRLGVTGTVLGAAFGSVVSTVAGAVYSHSLDRAQTRVTTTTRRLVRSAPDRDPADPAALPAELDDDARVVAEQVVAEEVVTEDVIDLPGRTEGKGTDRSAGGVPAPRRRPRWLIPAAAVVVFAVAMGTISLVEAILGHPVSGAGSTGQGGTTVTRVLTGDVQAEPEPSPTPSVEPTSSGASQDGSASPSPVDGESSLSPSADPGDSSGEPAPSITSGPDPSTEASVEPGTPAAS